MTDGSALLSLLLGVEALGAASKSDTSASSSVPVFWIAICFRFVSVSLFFGFSPCSNLSFLRSHFAFIFKLLAFLTLSSIAR